MLASEVSGLRGKAIVLAALGSVKALGGLAASASGTV